jgi:hypothetical protein
MGADGVWHSPSVEPAAVVIEIRRGLRITSAIVIAVAVSMSAGRPVVAQTQAAIRVSARVVSMTLAEEGWNRAHRLASETLAGYVALERPTPRRVITSSGVTVVVAEQVPPARNPCSKGEHAVGSQAAPVNRIRVTIAYVAN